MEVVINQTDKREDKNYLSKIENRIQLDLPEHLSLSPTENRAADRAAMTTAFRLNLTILSLIAILVGAYLILQALDAAVVRRRGEIATLRSMGVDGGVLFWTCLLEAFLIGIIGSVLGWGSVTSLHSVPWACWQTPSMLCILPPPWKPYR